jgi:hypothetical protein
MRRLTHPLVIVIACLAFGGCLTQSSQVDAGLADPPTDTTDSSEPDDLSSPDLGNAPDAAVAQDASLADVPVDTGGADIGQEDVAKPEDTAGNDAGVVDPEVVDAGVADAGVMDAGVVDAQVMDGGPVDGTAFCVNCPGTKAPAWELEDFQPASPKFGLSYGLEALEGKVTVMVLLAGW